MKVLRKIIKWIFLLGVLGIAGYIVAENYLYEQKIQHEITRFRQHSSITYQQINYNDILNLPAPVQRYLKFAVRDGKRYPNTISLVHGGWYRMSADQSWMSIYGEEYYRLDKPEYLWFSKISYPPGILIRARDSYFAGVGKKSMDVLSVYPLMHRSDQATSVTNLLRYLFEMPNIPMAFYRSNFLSWQAIDDHSARVTIKDGDIQASATFYFDADGKLVRAITNDRYRKTRAGLVKTPMVVRYGDYKYVDGYFVPGFREMAWKIPSGEYIYARYMLDRVDGTRVSSR